MPPIDYIDIEKDECYEDEDSYCSAQSSDDDLLRTVRQQEKRPIKRRQHWPTTSTSSTSRFPRWTSKLPSLSRARQCRPPLWLAALATCALLLSTVSFLSVAVVRRRRDRNVLPVVPATAEEQLAVLNLNYAPKHEGFGVGNVDMRQYRSELRRAFTDVLGSEVFEAPSDSLIKQPRQLGARQVPRLEDTLSFLSLDPASSYSEQNRRIKHELIMTSPDPHPPLLSTWQADPSLDVHLLDDIDTDQLIHALYPSSALTKTYDDLPIPIVKWDLMRLVALYAHGGIYTDADTALVKPFANWTDAAQDLTDPLLRNLSDPTIFTNPPAFIVAPEWNGREELNAKGHVLYNRNFGIVQWTIASSPGHPILLDAIRRVVDHSQRIARNESDSLHFDPMAYRAVLEWSGPAVLTDAVARYLRTRWGASYTDLIGHSHPIRIGDVLVLPLGAFGASSNPFGRLLQWGLGRTAQPLGDLVLSLGQNDQECVYHAHQASWYDQKPSKVGKADTR